MIIDAFDNSEVLFGPKNFYGEQKHLCDKCIIVFSEQIFAYMLETYTYEEAGIIWINYILPLRLKGEFKVLDKIVLWQ